MQLGLFLKVSFSTWCKFILASYCTCQEPGPSRQFGIKYKLFPSPMFLFLLFGYYLLLEFGICISICACIVLCSWCMSNLIIWGQRCCWFLCNSAVYSCDLVGLSDHIVAFVICISLLLWVTEMLSLGICKLHFFTTVFTKIISWIQGVGLKLDDALAFWKAEFSRKVSMTRYLCHINWESVDSIPYFITPKNMPYIVSNSEISFENLACCATCFHELQLCSAAKTHRMHAIGHHLVGIPHTGYETNYILVSNIILVGCYSNFKISFSISRQHDACTALPQFRFHGLDCVEKADIGIIYSCAPVGCK